jgi:hypothetical protein
MIKKTKQAIHREIRKHISKIKINLKKEAKKEDKKEEKNDKNEKKDISKNEEKAEEFKESNFKETILEEDIGFAAPVIQETNANSGLANAVMDSGRDLEDTAANVISEKSNNVAVGGNLYEIRSSYDNAGSGMGYDNNKYDNDNKVTPGFSSSFSSGFGERERFSFSARVFGERERRKSEAAGIWGEEARGKTQGARREDYSTRKDEERLGSSEAIGRRKKKRETF